MNQNIFSYSRFALQYGLSELNFKKEDAVLVPDFNCDAIYYPLRKMGLKLQFYHLNDNFTADWDSIQNLITSSSKAIMMVHYFGQPQYINEFINFASENNLLLIEDNAHGHSGTYKGKLLGTFGDIGFSSPRKQLNIAFGGTLYIKGKKISSPIEPFGRIHKLSLRMELFKSIPRFMHLRCLLKKYFLSKPKFSEPSLFFEFELENVSIDKYTIDRIKNTNWELVGQKRREAWLQWTVFCEKRNITPIWSKPNPESCPWLMPAYVDNQELRIRILDAAWESGLGILSWPGLSDYVVEHFPDTERRWKKLICFSLEKNPNDYMSEICFFDQKMDSN